MVFVVTLIVDLTILYTICYIIEMIDYITTSLLLLLFNTMYSTGM